MKNLTCALIVGSLVLSSIGVARASDTDQELAARLTAALNKLAEAQQEVQEVQTELADNADTCTDDSAPATPTPTQTGQFAQVTDRYLGASTRDKSGLIWGDLKMTNGKPDYMTYEKAKAYCEGLRGGSRLPHATEQALLGISLGAQQVATANVYSTEIYDEAGHFKFHYDYRGYKASELPHLADAWIWSDTPRPRYSVIGFVLNGYGGGIDYVVGRYGSLGGVRCVRQP